MLPSKTQAAYVVSRLDRGPNQNAAKPSARRIANKTRSMWLAGELRGKVSQGTAEKVIDVCRAVYAKTEGDPHAFRPMQRLESQSLAAVIKALETSHGFGQ